MTVTRDGSRKNGAQHVYALLKRLFVNYQIPPSRHLHPSDFVRSMRVSATPIRDAMHRLSGEQLLLFIPSRGFFSKALDITEMRELTELELVVLQHALFRTNQYKEMQNIVVDDFSVSPKNASSFCGALERLLIEITARSGSRSLTHMMTNLIDRTHYITAIEFEEESRRENVAEQIDEFLNHLRTGRNAEANLNLRRILSSRIDGLPELVKEGLARSHYPGRVRSEELDGFLADL
jgi:DNA-binding GntR family transcriptional regulator